MSKKKEVEESNQALAVQEPAELAKIDFRGDLETYHDEFDSSALQIPFLRILQSNSPQCTPGEPQYDEAARPGMLINTVSGELFKKVEIIPVYHHSTFIAWKPRKEGGGFVKDYGFTEGEKALATTRKGTESNRDILPDGNELVRTEIYFALVIKEDGSPEQVMITFTSTQLKKAKRWNSQFRMKKVEVPGQGLVTGPPMFFHSWMFSTVAEKNDMGSWMGYLITEGRPTLNIGQCTYLAAKEFREIAETGVAQRNISMTQAKEEVVDGPAPF